MDTSRNHIRSIADAWLDEMKAILKDEGVLLFFVFLPIAYPLLYSWIYNNEVAREVPVVLVGDSHTALSREFARKFDASPEVRLAIQAGNIEEAKAAIGRGEAYGILYFPHDFAAKAGRMEQATVGVYCDMSYMLAYKAILVTATDISLELGKEIQATRLAGATAREEAVATQPLEFHDVPIFNAPGGYGNFILPGVLVLIIQQAMALGVGMIAGTERERRFGNYRPKGVGILAQAARMLAGKGLCYIAIFAVMLAWVTLAVPHFFGFVSMVHGKDLALFLAPYLLACTMLAITISELVRYRESVMLVVVFSSLPLLFMSGLSWPQASIPGAWQGVAYLFPSTFAIRGFIRMSSMGALLPDVASELRMLWIQAGVYACTALFVMWRRVRIAKKHV